MDFFQDFPLLVIFLFEKSKITGLFEPWEKPLTLRVTGIKIKY